MPRRVVVGPWPRPQPETVQIDTHNCGVFVALFARQLAHQQSIALVRQTAAENLRRIIVENGAYRENTILRAAPGLRNALKPSAEQQD